MDITKALTIRVGADIYPFTTGIAAAGEALVWLTGKMKDLANFTKDGLIAGGGLAEATAGLNALSQKYGVVADDALQAFDRVTDGQLSLIESTQKLSRSMQMGFSPEQTAVIWQFANKYADVVGGSMEDVAQRIETAITKGRVKTLAEFGIMAQDGAEALELLKRKSEELGEGVFSFADSWKQVTNSVSDMSLAVWEQLNNIVGSKGFAGFSQNIRDMFWELKAEAGTIAAGIFATAETLIKPLYEMTKSLFDFITGGIIDTSQSWKGIIHDLAKFIVGAVYDIEAVVMGALSTLTLPLVKFAELGAKAVAAVTPGGVVSDFYGKLGENLNQFANIQEIILGRKNEQLGEFEKNYQNALAGTGNQSGFSQMPDFGGGYAGNQIQPATTGPASSASSAGRAVAGSGSGIVINVPKGDKIGEAIRDWLTVAALSEGTMRAGM